MNMIMARPSVVLVVMQENVFSRQQRSLYNYYLRVSHAGKAGIVFFQRLSASVSVCVSAQKLLIRNWCNLVEICAKVNLRSDWILVTSDLEFKA